MKKSILWLLFILGCLQGFSQINFTVPAEKINLSIQPGITDTIRGSAVIQIVPDADSINTVSLDLLKMVIDSVKLGGYTQSLQYAYNDTVLSVNLPSYYSNQDTLLLTVWYHGKPVIDPSGWGGFYFSGNIAYNLGVGFEDIPHSYGRVWFPCVDNFNVKSLYEFNIRVQDDDVAVCNGLLEDIDSTTYAGERVYKWVLHQPIPSYLASVAVGPYVAYTDTFNGQNGVKPILIYTPQTYASKVAGSFSNLKNILNGFEQYFGPYMWDRVGYVAVPFNSGAMEHATNIAYPQVCIDGTHTYESLYAHELSHHWFGDLITTPSSYEMWINEGWATFAESFFNEFLYGTDAYIKYINNVHAKALKDGAYDDGGWFSLDSVPLNVTYGTTSYNKGASVVHTLRYYMGDDKFFPAVRQMLSEHAWENVSSIQLRDYLSQYSGIDLTDFFDAWVFSPGYLHFSVDSFTVQPGSQGYDVHLYIRQRLYHKDNFANNNIVEFTLVDTLRNLSTYRIKFSGEHYDTIVHCDFYPQYAITDLYNHTLDASTSEYKIFSTTGTYAFYNEFFTLTVAGTVSDTAFINVKHNMVPPDDFISPVEGLSVVGNRYWKITNVFPQDLYYQAKFYFGSSGTTAHLDDGVINFPVDSLVLLYRRNASDNWHITMSHATGSSYSGYIILDEPLKSGEYALGQKNGYIPSGYVKLYDSIKVYPNPAKDYIIIDVSDKNIDSLVIYDSVAHKVMKKNLHKGRTKLATDKLPKGNYVFVFETKNGKNKISKKVILK